MGADPSTEQFLAGLPPDVTDLAHRARSLVFELMPDAVEQVKAGWKAIWYGRGAGRDEQLLVIQPKQSWVNLAFADGAQLPDPTGLLEGTGKRIRHVKLRRPEDVENPALRALVAAQVAIG